MCGFCKPPQSLEATKGCAHCKSNFCNECFKLYHPWGTPRAQHEHILPTNNFRPKVRLQPSSTLSAAAALFSFAPLDASGSNVRRARAGEDAVALPRLPEVAVSALQAPASPPRTQSVAYCSGLPGPQGEPGSATDLGLCSPTPHRFCAYFRTRSPRRSTSSWPTRRQYRVRSLSWMMPSNKWR